MGGTYDEEAVDVVVVEEVRGRAMMVPSIVGTLGGDVRSFMISMGPITVSVFSSVVALRLGPAGALAALELAANRISGFPIRCVKTSGSIRPELGITIYDGVSSGVVVVSLLVAVAVAVVVVSLFMAVAVALVFSVMLVLLALFVLLMLILVVLTGDDTTTLLPALPD